MMRTIDLRTSKAISLSLSNSSPASTAEIETTVTKIINTVRRNGDAALRLYAKKFDHATLTSLRVDEKEIQNAFRNGDTRFVKILRQAIKNIRAFHNKQRRANWKLKEQFGSELRQLYLPMEKVGVYVPGGKAAYPSTVLMNVIPAQVAGVKEIHLVSPPDKNGNVNSDVLLAAAILGINNVYRVGGAQAIAALAYGTETIPVVDKIVGPGNIFVATAKKMVFGKVGIDSFAGPSEVVILADDSANAEFIASDMLAQAEHDELASSILVTPSVKLIDKIQEAFQKFIQGLSSKEIIAVSLKNRGACILVKNIQQGIDVVNYLAPEHLEIITKNDEAALKKIQHAGAIFLGIYSPVAIGDYFAGSNHVLPTERTSRFSSPLSVDDFVKRSSVVKYSKKKMQHVADDVALFAERERLTAHALSIRLRKK